MTIWKESLHKRQFRVEWAREETGEHSKEFECSNMFSTSGGFIGAAQEAYGVAYGLSDKHYFKLFEKLDGRWVEIADLYTESRTLS